MGRGGFILQHPRQFFALCCLAILLDKAFQVEWFAQVAAVLLCTVAIDLLVHSDDFNPPQKLDHSSEQRHSHHVHPPTPHHHHHHQQQHVHHGTKESSGDGLKIGSRRESSGEPHAGEHQRRPSASAIDQAIANVSHILEQEALLNDLKMLYDEDRPFEAVQELQRLRANNLISDEARFALEYRRIVNEIDEARHEIFRLTDTLERESNWKFKMSHKKCDIFSSIADTRDFKVVCECPESNMFNLLSLIIETQFYKHWVPGVSESGRYDLSMFFQHLYLRFKLPFPLKDRDVLMKGYGDVWKGNKVMIFVSSIDSAEAEKKLNVKPGASRVDVIFSGILIKPQASGGAELTMIARIDLKMPLLPDALFDYAAKFVIAELCCYLRDRSKIMTEHPDHKENKLWTDRHSGSEAAVYNEIKERLSRIQVE